MSLNLYSGGAKSARAVTWSTLMGNVAGWNKPELSFKALLQSVCAHSSAALRVLQLLNSSCTALQNEYLGLALHVNTGHLLRILVCLITTWLIPQASASATQRHTQRWLQLPVTPSGSALCNTQALHVLLRLFITFYILKVSFVVAIFRCCSHTTFHTGGVKVLRG